MGFNWTLVVRTDEGWLYLAGVLDRWSRLLVGWSMQETLETSVATDALAMAVRQRQPPPGLFHHSDRGVQYASAAYRHQLAAAGMRASMSRKGNCYDNATTEAFFMPLWPPAAAAPPPVYRDLRAR